MVNTMALHDMYPDACVCGTLQYSEGHVKIASVARNVQDIYELNSLSMEEKKDIEFNLQVFITLCHATTF
jgi:hypothetical protein